MKKLKVKLPSTYEISKKIRRGWNGVNPVQKIVPNKKRKNRNDIKKETKKQIKEEI